MPSSENPRGYVTYFGCFECHLQLMNLYFHACLLDFLYLFLVFHCCCVGLLLRLELVNLGLCLERQNELFNRVFFVLLGTFVLSGLNAEWSLKRFRDRNLVLKSKLFLGSVEHAFHFLIIFDKDLWIFHDLGFSMTYYKKPFFIIVVKNCFH